MNLSSPIKVLPTISFLLSLSDLSHLILIRASPRSPVVHMDTGTSFPSTDESYYSSCDTGNFECHICFELAQEPVVTLCGHLYCWPCLYQWLQLHSHSHECPVCKALVQEENLVPIFGRGKTTRDPRTRSFSGLAIPNRPAARRPQTAPRVDMANYVRPPPQEDLDTLTGFMPMAAARFGHTTLSTLFGALPAIFNLQVNSFHDATVYGATSGVAYLFPSSLHGGYVHGFHNYHYSAPIEWRPVVWKVLFVFVGLMILLHVIVA